MRALPRLSLLGPLIRHAASDTMQLGNQVTVRFSQLPNLRHVTAPAASLHAVPQALKSPPGRSPAWNLQAQTHSTTPCASAGGWASTVPPCGGVTGSRRSSLQPQQLRQHRALHGQSVVAAAAADANGEAEPLDRQKPRLVLLDAFAVLYRAHFSFGPTARLTTTGGEDTSVLYGFLSVLLALLEAQPAPTHFGVVLDAGGSAWGAKNFRHELYPGYKGQRAPMPDEIAAALPKLVELLELMHIPAFQSPGLEADDIIATLAVRSLREGVHVTIASPDKDFFQLLRPGIDILRPAKPVKGSRGPGLVHYTHDTFREQFGLEPHQHTDMLALCGDVSDNVPGVRGIGPKTAGPLLAEHGDLEAVLAVAAQDPPVIKRKGVREALGSEEGAAAARLSRRLVALHTDVDVPVVRPGRRLVAPQTDVDLPVVRVPLEELRLQAPGDSGRAAMAALGTLEFRQHARRLQGIYAAGATGAAPPAAQQPAAAAGGQ